MDGERRRRYYSIGDVAKKMGIKPHVLRYWEQEFGVLRPRKNRAGNRSYTERDVKIVGIIRHLLYDEKLKIEGARQRMKDDREFIHRQLELPLEKVDMKSEMASIRDELVSVLEEISHL
jgi:DNA-binding transcriptional MerR regulator